MARSNAAVRKFDPQADVGELLEYLKDQGMFTIAEGREILDELHRFRGPGLKATLAATVQRLERCEHIARYLRHLWGDEPYNIGMKGVQKEKDAFMAAWCELEELKRVFEKIQQRLRNGEGG